MKRFPALGVLLALVLCRAAAGEEAPWKVDFRYAPPNWQTAICLPDDWQKTLVAKDGELLYDYAPTRVTDFQTRISLGVVGPNAWVKQELASPRVPIVRTTYRGGTVEIVQEALAVPLASPPAGSAPPAKLAQPPRHDLLIVRFHNMGDAPQKVTPVLTVKSHRNPKFDVASGEVTAGDTRLVCSQPIAATESGKTQVVLRLKEIVLAPGGDERVVVTIGRRAAPKAGPTTVEAALTARQNAEQFWSGGRLPYDRFHIPDQGIQALVESAMRNIYQAREIKNGLPAFQVGPTCYRGLWIVDGAFLLEAATYFGCGDDARPGIQYELTHQRADGGFTVLDAYWKETGIVLWTVTRHARLTGDKEWLTGVWPRVERGVEFIRKLRKEASADPKAPHYGLIPPGFPDGGLAGKPSEYTNVYWTLVGLRAAADAARWLGKTEQAGQWQREYDDLYAVFRKAADRDMRTDARGNRYLPTVMLNAGNHTPQRAQWAFCHAVFPGKIFPAGDPLVAGNMAMLEATEREGMVFGTGWAAEGLWNYFASFYGHAWLWTGEGQKAARSLYAMANHASPLLAWREEQMPLGKGASVVGDMPHNWASAEFIRLVRHLLVLERGDELHLLEGMPAAWAKAGAVTRLTEMPTEFGPMSLEVKVAADGRTAQVRVDAPRRNPPRRIVLHLGGWAKADRRATVDLAASGRVEQTVAIER